MKALFFILSLFLVFTSTILYEANGETVIARPIDQYQLVVKSSPSNLDIESSNMYEKNMWAQTVKAPKHFGAYEFVEWEVDDMPYPGNPISVLMDVDHTAVAIYSINSKQIDGIEDTSKTLSNENPRLTIISPYGQIMGDGQYVKGEIVKFKIDERVVYDDFRDGVRYIFDGWDSGISPNLTSNSIILDESITIRANWIKQYKLELINIEPDTKLIGGGWHDEDSHASLVASSDSTNGKTKSTFDNWISVGQSAALISDPLSPVTSITMNAPHTIMAKWKSQFYFDVFSPYGIVNGGGFYDKGAHVTALIDSEVVNTGKNGERVVFTGWDGDVISQGMNARVLLDEPKSVTAKWTKQYFLTVDSDYGIPHGSGWYDEGQIGNFGINVPRDPAGFWKQHIFYGWEGGFSANTMTGAILMNGPKSVTAQWEEDGSIAFVNILIIAGIAGGGFVAYRKLKKKSVSVESPVEQKK